MSRERDSLVMCGQCGLAHRWRPLAPASVARCTRCEAVLGRGHRLTLATLLSLTITASVVFLIAISATCCRSTCAASPGRRRCRARSRDVADGQQRCRVLAAITALIAPALFLALRLYVLVPLAAGRLPRGFACAFACCTRPARWNMVEVVHGRRAAVAGASGRRSPTRCPGRACSPSARRWSCSPRSSRPA